MNRNIESKKIAILVRDTVGGICRYSHELAEALATEGVSVYVVCRTDFPDYKNRRYERIAILGTAPGFSRMTWIGRFLCKALLVYEHACQPIRAFRFCKKTGIDCIHFSNGFHLGYWFWRHFRSPQLLLGLTVHDVGRHSGNGLASVLNRQLPKLYRDASLLFVHDVQTAKEVAVVSESPELQALVVPHGVYPYPQHDGGHCRISRKDGVKTGLFFGAIRDEKRLDLLLRALACRKHRRDWRLVVAGSESGGQHRPISHYIKLAASLGIADRVEFHSQYIPDEEVHQFFEAADWVSLVYGRSFTSQSGVLATAVYFKVPLLTCGAPLLEKTVTHYGIGINCITDEPDALLEIMEVIEKATSNHFDDGFKRFESEMSWIANARITMAAYEKLRITK